MTVEEARTILEEAQEEKRPNDYVFDGLAILHKTWGNCIWRYRFEEKQMWAHPDGLSFGNTVNFMSKEDVTRMGELGWFECQDEWSCGWYGSYTRGYTK